MNGPYYQTVIASLDLFFIFLSYLRVRSEASENKKNESVQMLSAALLFLTLYMGFTLIADISYFFNPLGVKILHNFIATVLIFITMGLLIKIPASIYVPKVKNFIPWLTAFYGLIIGAINLNFGKIPTSQMGVVYLNMPDWVVAMNLILGSIMLLFTFLFFLDGALDSKNKYSRKRYFIFAISTLLIFVSILY